jgi:hypothetical protein
LPIYLRASVPHFTSYFLHLLLAGKDDVTDADKRVAAAKLDVATAEKKVLTAEKKVLTAEKKVLTARQDYKDTAALKDAFMIGLAKQDIQSAQEGLQSAQEGLKSAQTILTAASNSLAAAMGTQQTGIVLPCPLLTFALKSLESLAPHLSRPCH